MCIRDSAYIEQMYHVMALQDYLAEYALRLTQATLEQENALYKMCIRDSFRPFRSEGWLMGVLMV